MELTVSFANKDVLFMFDSSVGELSRWSKKQQLVILTDENVLRHHAPVIDHYPHITIPPGESEKSWETIARLTERLIEMGADRNTLLVGMGGGAITDITGFLASTYMRGINFGFVPTTLLAMVDAAIGGKNGINVGLYKNMLGTIRQPELILYDYSLLKTLPEAEWSNAFAEVIKYACLFDKELFTELEQNSVDAYRENGAALAALIHRCVMRKNKVVLADEFERHERKLLNFGHTAGHALEKLYDLSHGQAVAIGMLIACRLSEKYAGLSPNVTKRVEHLLKIYQLPVEIRYDKAMMMNLIKSDKKSNNGKIAYILLNKIGKANIFEITIDMIAEVIVHNELS
jgi:3-dehydroquinate synthase